MSKTLCVFDLDGTLVNSISDISASMNYALKSFSCQLHTEEEYCQMVGDGMERLCQRALPNEKRELWKELMLVYHKHYMEHCCDHSKPYSGILSMISELKKNAIHTAVLSNKPHTQTKIIIDTLFAENSFNFILGQKEEFPRKPDPTALFYIISEMNMQSSSTIYIGDSAVDINLGQNAGVAAIGVAWGLRGEEELKRAKAQRIVHSPVELLEWIVERDKG